MGKPAKNTAGLQEGDQAPAFDLPTDDGGSAALADYRGKWLVLYFYPRDNTPGCTREAQAFTKLAATFRKANAEILGVSKDTVASHAGFRDKLKLKVPLASDTGLDAHKAYGAYGEKVSYGKKTMGVIRSTFLVDPKGLIRHVWRNVKVDGHAEAVLEVLRGD